MKDTCFLYTGGCRVVKSTINIITREFVVSALSPWCIGFALRVPEKGKLQVTLIFQLCYLRCKNRLPQ